jgi:ribosomal protein S6--L-glutamate ligase
MRILILSRDAGLYSTRRLVEAAEARGHEVRVVDVLRCYVNVSAGRPAVRFGGEVIDDIDAVIPRIGASVTFYGTAVLRQFEMMGVYTPNPAAAILRARDKLLSLQLLARQGIDLPSTGFANAPDDIEDLLRMVGGPPIVIKLQEGTQGVGIVLAETASAAESLIQAFLGVRANILVQEFVREAEGSDIRCMVVGDRVVAAIRRQAKPGDFRSNLHRGGTAWRVRITPQERAVAVRAARTIGLGVAGVDLLRSDRGPLVLEVNSSPGLEGVEAATGKDVAGDIVDLVARAAVAPRATRRGRAEDRLPG